MKKPQHPQATAAKHKKVTASRAGGAGGSGGGSAPVKATHPAAKAAKAAKHRAAAKKTQAAKAHKPRKWSPDESVALCSARAVAEAVRLLSGRALSDADMLALYWATASDPDEGASILDTLGAAVEELGVGLVVTSCSPPLTAPLVAADQIAAAKTYSTGPSLQCASWPHLPTAPAFTITSQLHPLILGLDWVAPHAVTVAPDGTWWSWGQPHTAADFPGAVIEEAWVITCAG